MLSVGTDLALPFLGPAFRQDRHGVYYASGVYLIHMLRLTAVPAVCRDGGGTKQDKTPGRCI
jgi:hypothetical protein